MFDMHSFVKKEPKKKNDSFYVLFFECVNLNAKIYQLHQFSIFNKLAER